FSRTVSNGWGNANTGGSWILLVNNSDYSVSNGTGRLNLGSANALRSASLGGVSVLDTDISFRATTNKAAAGSSEFLYGVVRRTSASNAYRVKLRIATNGAVFVQASSVIND